MAERSDADSLLAVAPLLTGSGDATALLEGERRREGVFLVKLTRSCFMKKGL